MLRVTVELVPGGDDRRARPIAIMTIANVSNLADISDYEFRTADAPNPLAKTADRQRQGVVQRHDRRQNVWSLVGKAATLASEG
jgi:hypothetical protein